MQKDGYQQQDVTVKREYQTQKALLNAINSGFNTGTFFNDAAMGFNSAVQSLNRQQATGEAYILVPTTVTVTLVPNEGFPRRSTESEAEKTLQTDISPIQLMVESDEQMLENALEMSGTGRSVLWTNDQTGVSFAVEPEEADALNGTILRYFRIGARRGPEQVAGRYPAYRVGRGEWVIGELPQAPESTRSTPALQAGGSTYRVLGEVPWPGVKKDWTVQESSRTSTSQRSDGSIVTKTQSSSTKLGVSVNPGAVLNVLDALNSSGTAK